MDERQSTIVAKAAASTLALLYIGLIVLAVWKYVVTKDILNSSTEIILLVIIPFAILWFSRKDEALLIPKRFTDQEVPAQLDAPSKRVRKKHYFLSALGLAIAFRSLDIIAVVFIEKNWREALLFNIFNVNENLDIGLTIVTEVVTSVIVFYIIGYFIGEWAVKRYNRKLAELENDDE